MSKIELSVKNMVCERCIKVILDEFLKNKIEIVSIELGKVVIKHDKAKKLDFIKKILLDNGFELLEDKKVKQVEQVKNILIDLIYQNKLETFDEKLSDYLKRKIGIDYTSITGRFSSLEGISIEQYFISQKIERAKELIDYNEFNIEEIAYKLGYSSVQHLSGQFKKITGLSPTKYQKLKEKKRSSIDNIISKKIQI